MLILNCSEHINYTLNNTVFYIPSNKNIICIVYYLIDVFDNNNKSLFGSLNLILS